MLKKTITYTDYNGVQRTEDFYFNLTKSELLEMEMSTTGGMEAFINKIASTQDQPTLIKLFKEIILKAYGEKDLDGVHFNKSEELSRRFSQTGAYDVLFMELATNDESAAIFVNGIIPQDVQLELEKQKQQ